MNNFSHLYQTIYTFLVSYIVKHTHATCNKNLTLNDEKNGIENKHRQSKKNLSLTVLVIFILLILLILLIK